jgi:hypothetical protein
MTELPLVEIPVLLSFEAIPARQRLQTLACLDVAPSAGFASAGDLAVSMQARIRFKADGE